MWHCDQTVLSLTLQHTHFQALGTDLTTLGLNLNSPDQLHKTFASPWADGPLKAEPDFKVRFMWKHAAGFLLPRPSAVLTSMNTTALGLCSC